MSSHRPKYIAWNLALASAINGFKIEHLDATALEFSAYDTFTRILDTPESFGFKKEDVSKPSGAIWFDHLHPTSATHAIVVREIEDFLRMNSSNVSSVFSTQGMAIASDS